MNSFKDFGIKTELKNFVGDKIKMKKILDKEIMVHAFKIGTSQIENGSGKYMQMQIEFEGIMYVVNSGSIYLMSDIQKVPSHGFPFKTTIKEVNESHLFT